LYKIYRNNSGGGTPIVHNIPEREAVEVQTVVHNLKEGQVEEVQTVVPHVQE
jgi:hypothetical protein